jgi:hypothetical protein
MTDDEKEIEVRKKAIFDTMAKRGQERILRIGYENWNPFQEPKDPRERIFSSASLNARALVKEFLHDHMAEQESPVLFKDLFELCRGLLQGEARAQLTLEFCTWYQNRMGKGS